MVRQRKDGDSLERVDGSKPTWKVCLDVRPILSCLHVLSVLVFVSYLCFTQESLTLLQAGIKDCGTFLLSAALNIKYSQL